MFNKISFSYFSLAALTALVQKIVKLLSTKLPDNQMATTFITRISPQLATALQAIGSTSKQPLTKKAKQADLRRDNSYRSLRDHIDAGMLRQNETYRVACETLWTVFEKNGLKLYDIAREKETAAIESLLKDLGKPEYVEPIKITKIASWIAELNTDNQAYVTVSVERSAIRASDDTVNDQNAFKDLKISLDLLENILNTMLAMNMPEGIDEIVAEVSQYISEANTAAKQSGANKKDDTPDDLPD